MKNLFLTLWSLYILGCAGKEIPDGSIQVSTNSPQVSQAPVYSVALKLGSDTTLPLLGSRVMFLNVQDSRCPTGATCVWEGDGIVFMKASLQEGLDTSFALHTNPAVRPNEVVLRGVRIRLSGLNPYPVLDQPNSKDKYEANLVVDLSGTR